MHIHFDAFIGRGYAGLLAAMALERSLRKVPVIGNGLSTDRQKPPSHNFTTAQAVERLTAKKNSFASGTADTMPDINSFRRCWGISVFWDVLETVHW